MKEKEGLGRGTIETDSEKEEKNKATTKQQNPNTDLFHKSNN